MTDIVRLFWFAIDYRKKKILTGDAQNKRIGGNIMFINAFFKFKGMRNPQEFTLYPCKESDPVIFLQSDRRMLKVEILTGRAIISRSMNYPTRWHCEKSLGAKELSLDSETIDKIKTMVKKMSPQTTKEKSIQLIG